MNKTDSVSCPMSGFGISVAEPLGLGSVGTALVSWLLNN